MCQMASRRNSKRTLKAAYARMRIPEAGRYIPHASRRCKTQARKGEDAAG